MAKKNNLTFDDNIHNSHHERRQELPVSRLRQTWQDEAANAAMDAYDNYRDRKADTRQQNQRIRDYQRERAETGGNSEQIHFQRRSAQPEQHDNYNQSQNSNNLSHVRPSENYGAQNRSQPTQNYQSGGHVRTDSSHQYGNAHTTGNFNQGGNVRKSDQSPVNYGVANQGVQRTSHQKNSETRSTYNGNGYTGSGVRTAGENKTAAPRNARTDGTTADVKTARTTNSKSEVKNAHAASNPAETGAAHVTHTGAESSNAHAVSNEARGSKVNPTSEAHYLHMNGKTYSTEGTGNSTVIYNGRKYKSVEGHAPAPGVVPTGTKNSGMGTEVKTEQESIPIVNQTEPETTEFDHEVNAVINPRGESDPANLLAPIEMAYKQSDVYQGYNTMNIVANTLKGSGKHSAETVLKAYGFERNKGVNIKTDINNKLALNERSLNMVAINVANLNVGRLNSIISHREYKGQKLTDTQIKLLEERRDLLSAKGELQRKGYNLSNLVVDQSLKQSDAYRGAKMAVTAGRIGAKTTNVLISAPASMASGLASGTARIVGSQRLEKAGDALGNFAASSLTGKVKMVGSGTAHIVGKGAGTAGRAIGHAASQTRAGQAVANRVVRVRVAANNARVRIAGTVNNGRARVVNSANAGRARVANSKAGQAVSAARARIANTAGRIGNRFSSIGNGIRNSKVGRLAARAGNGVKQFGRRVNTAHQQHIIKKNRRKQKIARIFRKIKIGAIVAVGVVCMLTLIVATAGGAIGSLVSSFQGATVSSSTDTDEQSLMQKAIAKMYSTQVSIEDNIRDGSGGTTDITPATTAVKLNGSALGDGLRKIGLGSIMDGITNMTTDDLNIAYHGKAERINDTVENYYTYTANANGSVTLKVKDKKVSYYQKKKPKNMNTTKNQNKKIKIYYKDICDENNADLITTYKKPVVDDTTKSQEDSTKYSEPSFSSTEYFEVKAKDLDDLANTRWTLDVSGGITTNGPFERHHYTPAGVYNDQTIYGPAASKGKTGDYYTVPEARSDGKMHVSADSESPDPKVTMKVVDNEGNVSSINQLYKAICCIASAGTGNTSTDADYFNDWCTYLFIRAISAGDVTVDIQTSPDENNTFCWYGYLDSDVMPCNGSEVEGAGASKFSSMSKGDRYLYTAQAVKMDVSVEYVIHFDFDDLLKKGDGITYEWQTEHTDDCPWKEKTWKGFHNDDGTLNDVGESAKAWFEMDDSAFEELGVIFPGNTYPILSDMKIALYLAQIKQNCGGNLSQARTDALKAALQYVGRFTYVYSGGHGSYGSKQIAADKVGNSGGVDCSGFVSFVMNQGGVLKNNGGDGYTAMSASGFSSYGKATSKGALRPGDIVVKNGEAGGSTTSNNHVVIYGGKFDTGDGAGTIDRFIECTTTNNMVDGQEIQQCSGSQISKASRSNYIFGKYQYYRNPYGD